MLIADDIGVLDSITAFEDQNLSLEPSNFTYHNISHQMYNESDQSVSAANMEREIEIDERLSDLDFGFNANLIFESSETEFDACDFEDEPIKKKFKMDENLSENSDILEFMNDANESDLDSHHTILKPH